MNTVSCQRAIRRGVKRIELSSMLVVSLLNCDLCDKGLKMSTGQSTLKNDDKALMMRTGAALLIIGTFRSDYDYEYEYEFFNVYPVRMPDCVRLSRQLVLSSKSRRRLDANYEIFNKSRPPTTSSLQVQRRAKSLVFKGADTL